MTKKVKSTKPVKKSSKVAPPAARRVAEPAPPAERRETPAVTPMVVAQTIKPSNNPVKVDGRTEYRMVCIVDGRQQEYACTHAVYRGIKADNLALELRSDFHLRFDDQNRVDHIALKAKANSMPGFTASTDTEGKELETRICIARDRQSGALAVESIPRGVTGTTANAVADSLSELSDSEVRAGLLLGDRYKVVEVRQLEDKDLIFVRAS